MVNRRPICIVGPNPLPTGGIAVHVESLVERLSRDGIAYRVFRYGTSAPSLQWRALLASAVHFVAALKHVIRWQAVLHVHISSGRIFLLSALPLFLIGHRRPIIITVHSGAFPKEIAEAKRWKRLLLGLVFRRARYVVAVSESVRLALLRFCKVDNTAAVVIPPFLGSPNVGEKIARETRTVIASGYGTRLYGWADLVSALRDIDCVSRVNLVLYNIIDDEYIKYVRAQIAGDSRFVMHRDVARLDFIRMLAKSELFVRPTYADGDSLALREALDAGCKVVASDCVARPAYVNTYRTGDVGHLRERIVAVLKDEMPQTFHAAAGDHAYQALLDLYAKA
jgi:glycogen(starch) synthase